MGKKSMFFGTGVAVVLLFAIYLLWNGRQDAGYRFQKRQEECSTKWDTGQRIRQKARRKETQQKEQEWVVTEDVQGSSMGRNLSYRGRFLLKVEEEDSLFVAGRELYAGAALYGGEDVLEQEIYNIYRLKDGVWEVFVSHPPESVNNERIEHHNWRDEEYRRTILRKRSIVYFD